MKPLVDRSDRLLCGLSGCAVGRSGIISQSGIVSNCGGRQRVFPSKGSETLVAGGESAAYFDTEMKGLIVDKKLRLGVIGAGSWATAAHLPTLAARNEVEMIAVNRLGEEPLERVKNRFGFQIASENFRDVLDAGVDIVVVSSPSSFHREHAGAALEAGAHVLCEKPMTLAPDDAWELVEIARRVDRQLLLSFGWNYMPVVRQAKALMDTQGIGSIEQMSVTMGSSTRELLTNTGSYPESSPDSIPNQDTWTNPAQSGGGYGQAQLTHALGLALHLSGMRATDAFAYMSAPFNAPVELHDAIVLRFDGGAIGTLSGASTHVGAGKDKHQLDIRIVGSEGQLFVDLFRELVWLYRSDGRDFDLKIAPGEGLYDASGPANALVDIALGEQLNDCAPGELGARTVEALSLAYRSSASGKSEHL